MELNAQELEDMLVEITTGKRLFFYNNIIYAAKFPTVYDMDVARIVQKNAVARLMNEGLPTVAKMRQHIKKHNLLERGFYVKVKKVKEAIKKIQKNREMSNSQTQIMEIDLRLDEMYNKLGKLEVQEERLLENTCEFRAEQVRLDYLVSRCIFTGAELEDCVWESFNNFNDSTDLEFCAHARKIFLSVIRGLSPEALRLLARSQKWKNIWNIAKKTGTGVFEGGIASWDKNKINICYWSDFYDSIYSYNAPPSEDIINDDKRLFEWIRETNRLNAAENAKSKEKSKAGGEQMSVKQPYKVRSTT